MPAKKYSAEPNRAGSQVATDIVGLGDPNVQSYKIALDSASGGLLNRLDIPVTASGRQNQLIVRDYGGQVYNVKSAAFGAVGDGVTDDTAAIQAALNLFGSATGNTGVIYFPEGTYLISNTLVFQGSTTSAIRIMGAVGATGSGTGAKIKWGGAAGGTMLYLLASNGGSFENLDFDCNSSALYGIWIDATNTTTGSSTAITGLSRAANVVTVNVPGHGLTIGNLYTITITGAVPTTFNVTATALVTDANNLTFSQTGTTQAASTPGTMAVVQSGTSSNNRFHQIGVFSPSGTNSAGVAIGHTTSGGTPQVSELVFNQCVFAGRQILNGSYNGIIQLCAGNTKNVTIADTIFNGHNVNLNFTQASGTYHFSKVICSLAQTMDVSFGSASLFAEGFEVENSIAGATFLTSTGNGASIVLQSCYWLGIAGASDVIIAVAGNLTMLGNQFLNNRTGASVPKIQLSDPLFNAAGADTIFSQGNWFQNVAAGAYIPVVDGSANVVVNAGGGAFYGNKAVNVTSLGDWGGATGALTHLSNWIPTKTLIAQQSAGTPGIAATGFIRMGNVDAINFRNAANSADVLLISGNASDQVVIGGTAGAVIPGGPLTLGIASSVTGTLILTNAGGATTTSIEAGNAAATRTLRLPTVDPTAGQALIAAAPSGNNILLSYATVAGSSGTASAGQVAFWSSSTTLTGNAGLTYTAGGPLTITPAANTAGEVLTGFSLTGANAQTAVDWSGTWNTSGAPTFFNIDVTNTASGSALLVNWKIGGTVFFQISKTGGYTLKSDGFVVFSGRSFFNSTADGIINLFNNAGSGFTRLNFGGTTSSFPSWAVSGAGFQALVADGTVAAAVQRKYVVSPQTGASITVSATADFEKTFTNTGAVGSITFNLPAATGSGIAYTFIRNANQSMVIDAAGTDTIQAGSSVTSAGGTATLDAVGSSITIIDAASGKWFATAGMGSATLA